MPMPLLAVIAAAVLLQSSPAGLATLARDGMSRVDAPRQAVARTAEEWSALWRDHAGDAPPPAVDLTSRMVAAVFLGARPSAGYAVEITGTRLVGGVLTVEWRERRPKPGQLSAQVITAPAHIVSLPRVEGDVRFMKVDR
jgi:hypothetical protein